MSFYDIGRFKQVTRYSTTLRQEDPYIGMGQSGCWLNQEAQKLAPSGDYVTFLHDAEHDATIIQFHDRKVEGAYRYNGQHMSCPTALRVAYGTVGPEDYPGRTRKFRITKVEEGLYFSEADKIED